MYVNNAITVSQALSQGLHYLRRAGRPQDSRVGEVLVSPKPVMTVYSSPLNRVLFSPMRDANPFFHLMESLWMLAGRNDLPWLVQFNKRFVAYSDDGGQTQPGAYGHRWRNYFGYDQLAVIIKELKANPQTRRAVLAMWDGGHSDYDENEANSSLSADLLAAVAGSADVPCNTHAYFDTIDGSLNMTVCCRSNDIIWGAYGANAVHFSFLLEYVAAMTGLPMGVYRQLSNNFHMYTNVVSRDQMMPMSRDADDSDRYMGGLYSTRDLVPVRRVPLVRSVANFDGDLAAWFKDPHGSGVDTPFLTTVATPMLRAWELHKQKNYDEAIHTAESIRAQDWQIACVEWLQRRQRSHEVNKERFTAITIPTAQDAS